MYEVFDIGSENTSSIFGGGGYDDLLSLFSDEKISGTGFGMGVLMLSLFLKTYNLLPEEILIFKLFYEQTVFYYYITFALYPLKTIHDVLSKGLI